MADGQTAQLILPSYGAGAPEEAHVLVVDDDPDILRVVRFYLAKHRYHIETAENGREALEVLARNPDIELVLSDVMMPEMSGLELLRNIKANALLADIPVILISAEGETSRKVAGLNLGADDFITKPFNFDELTARVRNHLRLRRLQREVLVANNLLRERNDRFLEDLEAARTVQLALLPNELPQSPHFRLGTRYLPMERVGGDFFDVVELENASKLGVLVADVCGHGIAAALITAMTKITFRNACFASSNPAEVLDRMNKALVPNIKDGYVTAYYGILDPARHQFSYASGGHPPLLVHRRRLGELFPLPPQSTFLGTFESVEFRSETLTVEPGDRILFYTDGLYESRIGENEFYGEERFLQTVRAHPEKDVQEVLDQIVDDWRDLMGDQAPGDDITLVGLDICD